VSPATRLSDLAAMYGTTIAELRSLNPHFLLERTPNNRSYPVRLPVGALQYAQAGVSEANLAD
jgi:hypothetical protein